MTAHPIPAAISPLGTEPILIRGGARLLLRGTERRRHSGRKPLVGKPEVWIKPQVAQFNDAHLLLAIADLRLGRLADAQAGLGKMLKINPAIIVQSWRL